MLGDELRVKPDGRRIRQFSAEFPQLAVGSDVVVVHAGK
jgi:hypothetical protein